MNGYRFEISPLRITNTSDAPRGSNVYYKCSYCGSIVPSQPADAIACACNNIYIDPDYIRLVVRDFAGFNILIKVKSKQFPD